MNDKHPCLPIKAKLSEFFYSLEAIDMDVC